MKRPPATRGKIRLDFAGCRTVRGERAEDAATGDELRDMGCDALQGFHLSPPLPPEALDAWLSRTAPVR